jgi:hypothetical protein
MSAVNSPDTLPGLFKEVYSKLGLITAVPTWAICQDRFPFERGEAIGDAYVVAVTLSKENGFTYAPSTGANAVPASPTPIAATIQHAKIQSYAIYLASQLAYSAAARAASQGKAAFKSAYAAVLENMKFSHMYRLECSLLYGTSGIGIVSANNAAGTLTISEASFGTGIWAAGLVGAIVTAWDSTDATANQVNGDLTITAVDVPNRKITVSGTSNSVVATNILYFKNSRTSTAWNECAGLYKILTNTGLLFEIDASLYDSWRSQYLDCGGQVSMTQIMKLAAECQSYGLENALLFIAPERFADLASDEAALRRYVDDGARAKRGPKTISFSMGGVDIEIMSHPLIKLGHAFLLPMDEVHRIGSTDVTMALPGSNEELTVQVYNLTAIEFRSMSDQGIFLEVPARAGLLDGITS